MNTSSLLAVHVADPQGLQWAQAQVIEHHYLHAPVDPRCSPVAYMRRHSSSHRF